MTGRTALLVAALALLPLAAQAQTTYRCTAKDGKKYYGQSIPPQCTGVPVEQLSASGTVTKRIDPQASADERAKKDAEEIEHKKQEALNKDQSRRDQALLATYGSEKDVEDMRGRALEDNQRLIVQTEANIAALKERAAKSPGAGVQDELRLQQSLLESKQKEQQAINAKYDDDRKRYLQLTGKLK